MEYEIGKRLDEIQERLEKIEMMLDSFLEVNEQRYSDDEEEDEEVEQNNADNNEAPYGKQIIKNR